MADSARAVPLASVRRLSSAVEAVLGAFVGGPRSSDPGPLVLSALAAQDGVVDERAQEAWLDALDADAGEGRIDFGPTCSLSGLAVAGSIEPGLGRLGRRMWRDVARIWPRHRWRTRDIGWGDYDLISGPAGLLLNLAATAASPRALADQCVRQLLALCADEDLAAFRLGDGQGGDLNRWNDGHINTGVAHGVAGVALALKAALERGLTPVREIRAALVRVAEWLAS